MSCSRRNQQGFTLIELLVVIAIIAILAAVLFPTLRQAMENGKRAACSSQMQQIGKALFAYADDYHGRAPYAGGWSMSNQPTGGVVKPTGPYFIARVLGKHAGNSEQIWVCPATPYKATDTNQWYMRFYYSQWVRWDTDVAVAGRVPCPDDYNLQTNSLGSMAGQPLNSPNFAGMSDNRLPWKNTPATRVPLLWDQRYRTWDAAAGKLTDKYDLIHKGGWNILFLDGHVIFHYQENRSSFTPL